MKSRESEFRRFCCFFCLDAAKVRGCSDILSKKGYFFPKSFLDYFFSLASSRNAISASLPPPSRASHHHNNLSFLLQKRKKKKRNETEIADAKAEAEELDRRAALSARSAEELEREIGTATRDVARLKASFPALEGQAREAEAKLEAFR